MTFLHWTLLLGAGLSVLPIVFHMRSRRTPQKLLFPALRFVRETVVIAERGWKVKHWLLLAMRVLLVLLLAFALAAPRVHSNMLATYLSVGMVGLLAVLASVIAVVAYATHRPRSVTWITGLIAASLWGISLFWGSSAWLHGPLPPTQSSTGPIATILVIDTSPTMDYLQANQSRLDVAKEFGQWLIDRLPAESEIAILGSDRGARLSTDRVTALRQLSRLTLEGKAAALPERIANAIELVRSSKLERREIYVLSDLRSAAWRDAAAADLPTKLERDPPVLVQVIDLGIESTRDWRITDLKLSQEVLVPGGSVELQATVSSHPQSPAQQLSVELIADSGESRPVQRDGKTVLPTTVVKERQMLELEPGQSSHVQFLLRDLTEGIHHLSLQLGQPDPLRLDNQVYASIDVREHGRLLVVSDDPEMGAQVAAIPDPQSAISGASNSEVANYFRLDTIDFQKFACVVFLDPPALTEPVVQKLNRFIQNGGGLLNVLGARSLDAQSLNASFMRSILPGPAKSILEVRDDPAYFVIAQPNHPVFYPLESTVDEAGWNRLPVFQYWGLETLDESATALIRYSGSGLPALVEQPRGQGRILTLTTTVPEPSFIEGRAPWNELWSGTYAWQSFGLMVGTIRYLSGWGKNRVNYVVGQTAVLENEASQYPIDYTLFAPNDEVAKLEAKDGYVKFPYTRSPGSYRLMGSIGNRPVLRGFSVNAVAEDFDLTRVPDEVLRSALGEDRFSLAKEKNDVTHSIGQARFGRELYPFAMLLIVALLIAEQAMSSRFYSIRMSKAQ